MSHGGLNDPFQRLRLKIQFAFCLGIRYASHLSPVVNNIRTTIPFESILNRYLWRWWSIQPSSKRRAIRARLTVDHSQSDKRQDCPALRLQRWRLLHPQCVTTTIRLPISNNGNCCCTCCATSPSGLNQVPSVEETAGFLQWSFHVNDVQSQSRCEHRRQRRGGITLTAFFICQSSTRNSPECDRLPQVTPHSLPVLPPAHLLPF